MEKAPKGVQLGDLVKVQWVDALSCRHMDNQGSCWVTYDDNETWDLATNVTVGHVLHIDDDKIVLTPTVSISAHNHCDTPLIIPMGCLTHFWSMEMKEVLHV